MLCCWRTALQKNTSDDCRVVQRAGLAGQRKQLLRTKNQGQRNNYQRLDRLAFGIRPAALGTNQERGGVGTLGRNFAKQGRGQGFVEEVSVVGGLLQATLEANRWKDLGNTHAARLLATSRAIRAQRSLRLWEASKSPFSVRPASTGRMRSTPSSWPFR